MTQPLLFVEFSGKPDDGAGSSFPSGCVADEGSDASIDSSLPTSALASGSPGFRLSLRSRSRSGGAEMTAGGALRDSFTAFTAASPRLNIAAGKRAERRSAFRDRLVSTGCGGGSANGQRAVCVAGVLGHDGTNAHDASTHGPDPLCRLAVRPQIDRRFLVLLCADGRHPRLSRLRSLDDVREQAVRDRHRRAHHRPHLRRDQHLCDRREHPAQGDHRRRQLGRRIAGDGRHFGDDRRLDASRARRSSGFRRARVLPSSSRATRSGSSAPRRNRWSSPCPRCASSIR